MVIPDAAVTEQLNRMFANPNGQAHQLQVNQAMLAVAFLVANILNTVVINKTRAFDKTGLKISVSSRGLPLGAGLGSSAAFSVALAASCVKLLSDIESDILLSADREECDVIIPPAPVLDLINGWSFAAETLLHGTPSGLDNTASCFGGIVKYNKTPKPVFEKLSLATDINILLTNTRVPRSTKALVAGVKVMHEKFPKIMEHLFQSIEEISAKFLHLCTER